MLHACAHVALPPEVDRHREVGFPQIFMHKKRNTNFFFLVWVWVKKMHLGVSKYIFVDKVVVGHGVWLYVKRIGWKSQYTVFTVKFFSFFWGIERFASSVIQVMVGANGPVRGPHPIRASEQEKEIQGGMVGKKSDGAEVLDCGRVAKRVISWSLASVRH